MSDEFNWAKAGYYCQSLRKLGVEGVTLHFSRREWRMDMKAGVEALAVIPVDDETQQAFLGVEVASDLEKSSLRDRNTGEIERVPLTSVVAYVKGRPQGQVEG